jgi:hypothetical protein
MEQRPIYRAGFALDITLSLFQSHSGRLVHMKREVEREQKLPSFKIGIAELEVLFDRLVALFPEPENVHCSIDLNLKSEKLEFDNVAELKQYGSLNGEVTKFSLWLSQGGKRIWLRSSGVFGGRSAISAKAENEAWCAGAIETASSFLQSHRLWYHWFISSPLGWVLSAFAYIPIISGAFLPKGMFIEKPIIYAWVGITATLAILYVARSRLLPASILVFSKEEGFFQRNAAQLSLLIAIISAVLTVIGWYVGK